MSGSEACGRWGGTSLPRVAGSVGALQAAPASGLRGRARGDFIGLVRACSDTHEPEHNRRRGAVPCASRGREGYRTRALDRRDRFAVNRAWGGGGGVGDWWPTRRPCSPADGPPPSPRRVRPPTTYRAQNPASAGPSTRAARQLAASKPVERVGWGGRKRRDGPRRSPCSAATAMRARRASTHLVPPSSPPR